MDFKLHPEVWAPQAGRVLNDRSLDIITFLEYLAVCFTNRDRAITSDCVPLTQHQSGEHHIGYFYQP